MTTSANTLVLKTQYVNEINATINTGGGENVSGTDITRAANVGVTIQTQGNVVNLGYATVGQLDTTNIEGNDIKVMYANQTKKWSNVRRLRYVLTGSGATYYRYAYILNAMPYAGPTSSSAVLKNLNVAKPIDASNLNSIIASLSGTVDSYHAAIQYQINYCHSSCHSNCHVSRGRR